MYSAQFVLRINTIRTIVAFGFSESSPRTRHGHAQGRHKDDAHYTTINSVVVMPDGSLQTKADRISAMTKAKTPETLDLPDVKFVVSGETIVINWISAIQGQDARFTRYG